MFEIEIFDINSLNSEKFEHTLELMPENRIEKINSYHFEKDKKLLLGAGILLNNWLEKHNISYKNVEFLTGEYGKTQLKNYPELHFNLSHAGEYVVLATSNKPIGVDIEKIKHDYLEISENFFTKEERQSINQFESTDEKEDMFFRLWTLKESYMKATGLGFSIDLKSFCINMNDISFLYPQKANEYLLKELKAPKGYKLSVCCKK